MKFLFRALFFISPCDIMLLHYAGCKHKGHWNCNKTYTGRHKPNSLSSNLVFSYSCSNLCHYSVKLFEQGEFLFTLCEQGELSLLVSVTSVIDKSVEFSCMFLSHDIISIAHTRVL